MSSKLTARQNAITTPILPRARLVFDVFVKIDVTSDLHERICIPLLDQRFTLVLGFD